MTIDFSQAQFYNTLPCNSLIGQIETRYRYIDERNEFANLVNFSTAKEEPFQGWVRYREGYSTKLVESLIMRANISSDREFIADPMVGSGSTLISGLRKGFSGFGIDINPFCELIIRTKLLNPSNEDYAEVFSFLARIKSAPIKKSSRRPPLSEYFPENNLISMLYLDNAIKEVKSPVANTILRAAWFFTIEPASNRKKDGNGLATVPSKVSDVIDFFSNVTKHILSDFMSHPLPSNYLAKAYIGSACDFANYSNMFAKETGKTLGAVIFSPPYANSFDYFESYKMELLFGHLLSAEDYQKYKKQQIRNYRICYGKELHSDYPFVEAICQEIMTEIPIKEAQSGKKDSRTRLMPNMLRGYFQDMGIVLKQIYNALPSKRKCFIVVDQSSYVGVIVPTDVLLAKIAEAIGFNVISISICRKAATSAQQFKKYPYLKDSLRESIVTLEKN